MNFTTTHIRSEKVTIDTRIYTILNGRKKPGEVYLAAIAPDMELTVITLDEAPGVRCDIQAYYAVLATITYPSGDVVYVSGLTKLASINDIVNLVESVTLL